MAPKKAASTSTTKAASTTKKAAATKTGRVAKPKSTTTKAKTTKAPAVAKRAKTTPKTSNTSKTSASTAAPKAGTKPAAKGTKTDSKSASKAGTKAGTKAGAKTGPKASTKATVSNGVVKNEAPTANEGKKRGRKDEADGEEDRDESPPPKKQRGAPVGSRATKKKRPVINEVPKRRLNVYVFGEGSSGELGLGAAKTAIDVKRPRLNPHLPADTVGVVQIACGGMHVAALTHDNQILTWGVNDQGALGRDTTWEGGLRDIDAEDSDSDASDSGLNPRESTPTAVSLEYFPKGTIFTQVAAGDSTTFALTDDGQVYGWGTFRSNEGILGFTPDTLIQSTPTHLPALSKITSLTCGDNHVLALSTTGAVYAWGSGQQNQLGRRVVERTRTNGLTPREFGLPRSSRNKITSVAAGAYHSFATDSKGQVWAWGLNSYGETGITEGAGEDEAVVLSPQVVSHLAGHSITHLAAGAHHSLAVTADGACLVWGRVDGGQAGIPLPAIPPANLVADERGNPRILRLPTPIPALASNAAFVAAGSDHCVAVTRDGKALAWGFSGNYQTGLGTSEDVAEATLIDNTAVRGKQLCWAGAGGQFSVLAAEAEEKAERAVNGV